MDHEVFPIVSRRRFEPRLTCSLCIEMSKLFYNGSITETTVDMASSKKGNATLMTASRLLIGTCIKRKTTAFLIPPVSVIV